MTECSKLFVCPIWRYRRLSQEPYVTLWKGVNLPGILGLRKSKLNTERGSTGGNRFQFQPHQNHKVHVSAASTYGSGLSTPNQFMSWKRGLSKPRRWTDCYWSLVNISTYINLKSLGADQVSTGFDLQRWQLHATGITFQGFLSEKDGERLWTSDLVLVRWKIQLVQGSM